MGISKARPGGSQLGWRQRRTPNFADIHTPANAASLHRSGVRIALGTGGLGTGRSVVMEAVVAKAHGLPEETALAAVTSDAASILGIGDRVGTLAAGMDADIVLWERRPISTWTETRRVIVGGETVFER